MSRYYIWSVGCQMNRAFADRLGDDLQRMGYARTPTVDDADVIVVNTCVVRQSAESRVVSKLDSLLSLKRLRPDAMIAVTGCLVDPDGADLSQRFPHVDLFLKAGDSSGLLEVARSRIPAGARSVEAGASHPTAYVTVMEGCNNFCTYCIVPYRRGRERSRLPGEVCAEIEQLVRRGVREVTLLGQNVDSYGRGLPGRMDLAGLLEAVDSIKGLARVRFLTSHPRDMSDRLISAVASLARVCECISLPVQAGDDRKSVV